jgi:hypothetical protein
MATGDYQIYELENLTLQRGITLPRGDPGRRRFGLCGGLNGWTQHSDL